jgi:glycine/D-amino acid oxidase-like deaminating enzyme
MSVPSLAPRSLWADQVGPIERRSSLPGSTTADVAIVGAGYSGLWTAYYLLRLSPGLRVVVLEREHAGFGASGRNGGWAVGEFANHAPVDQARAAFAAVTEIGEVCAAEGIECDYRRGGTVRLARTGPQWDRQRVEVAEFHARGFGDDDLRLLSADEARGMLEASRVRGGLFFAHTAVVHPLRLARGLADAVARHGGVIHEGTPVTAIEPDRVVTPFGEVHAGAVVQAVEAYTRDLPGQRRQLVPFYSQMVATEPLTAEQWESIGLAERPTFCDDRRMVIYGQRTGDGRIAFGARGHPAYLYGSRISADAESRAHLRIAATLRELLPQLTGVEVTHRWGGVLGIPRDWRPGIAWDPATRFARPGGYVGEGVAAANLAGRTVAELLLGHDTEHTHLAWVGHRSRRWEPEPLRWAAINAAFAAIVWGDRREARTGRESRLAATVLRLTRR